MSYFLYDPDEWETVSESSPTSCGVGRRRRSPEAVAKIKAERRKLVEDAVLAEAAQIMAARGQPKEDEFLDERLAREIAELRERVARLEGGSVVSSASRGCVCPASLQCGCASQMCPRRAIPNLVTSTVFPVATCQATGQQ